MQTLARSGFTSSVFTGNVSTSASPTSEASISKSLVVTTFPSAATTTTLNGIIGTSKVAAPTTIAPGTTPTSPTSPTSGSAFDTGKSISPESCNTFDGTDTIYRSDNGRKGWYRRWCCSSGSFIRLVVMRSEIVSNAPTLTETQVLAKKGKTQTQNERENLPRRGQVASAVHRYRSQSQLRWFATALTRAADLRSLTGMQCFSYDILLNKAGTLDR